MYSGTPTAVVILRGPLRKQLEMFQNRCLEAEHRKEPVPAVQPQWILSSGRPEQVFTQMGCRPIPGKLPFSGSSWQALCWAQIQEQPAPLRQAAPAVPRALEILVHDMLDKSGAVVRAGPACRRAGYGGSHAGPRTGV